MSMQPLKWLPLGPVFTLLLLGHSFGDDFSIDWTVPEGQPAQGASRVDYDPKLTDPFFKSNKWSYPWHIIKHPDGHFEDTFGGRTPEKEPPRLKHTAKCFSISFGEKHVLKFCEAKLLDVKMIDLLIHETNAAFAERLRVQMRNGMFTCQYWSLRYRPPYKGWIWTTITQKLTLDRKVYRKGDVIKGRIEFECLQEQTDPEFLEKYGRFLATIKTKGVFKTIVE